MLSFNRELKHATTTVTTSKTSLKKKASALCQTLSLLIHHAKFVKCYVRYFSGSCVLKFSITVFKKRKGKSLSYVHILHDTSRLEVSRHCHAVTATKCAKILNARAKLLFFIRIRFCLKTDIFFLRLSLPSTLTNAVKNYHRKRTFSITLFRVWIFENVGFSFTSGSPNENIVHNYL